MKNQHIKTSKFLSYILRHKPEAIGLAIDENGWAIINDLIECAANNGKVLNTQLRFEEELARHKILDLGVIKNGRVGLISQKITAHPGLPKFISLLTYEI